MQHDPSAYEQLPGKRDTALGYFDQSEQYLRYGNTLHQFSDFNSIFCQ
jgi:hypothetical protein